jgi:parvulin-like peptidyl-prolyl isomerase
VKNVPSAFSATLRPHRVLSVLAVGIAAVALSSCATAKSPAIRVGAYQMTKDAFEVELNAQSRNAQLAEQLGGAKLEGEKAKWNPKFVADALNNVMVWQAINAESVAEHISVKPTDVDAQTKDQIFQAFGGEKEFGKLPLEFQNRQFTIAAQVKKLIENASKKQGTPEAYFAKNKAKYPPEVCASHILVKTEAEALAAKKRVDGGEDFAGGKDKGGDLGCTSPDSYVAEFAAAVKTLAINAVSTPVKTQFGYHVIKVSKRAEASFASKKQQIIQELEQQGSLQAQKVVFGRLTAKSVTVDPALGSLDFSGQFPVVKEPLTKIAPKAPAGASSSTLAQG